MTFQFTCPQGHLLEGDPAHAGMQSQCPMCGTPFIIPEPAAMPSDAPPEFPGVQTAAQQGPETATEPTPPVGEPEDDPDRIVHIFCPNGHELETPMSMVGTDAMCPHCEAEFRLRYEDSKEYREQKAKQREMREAAFGRKALQWAIVTAALVMLGLLGLIIATAMS